MIGRFAIILSLVFGLAACASVPPANVPFDRIAALRLANVSVEFAAPVTSWPAAETRFLAGGVDPQVAEKLKGTSAARVPEAQPFLQAQATELVAREVRANAALIMTGATPATIVVRVTLFDVPSMMRRVLVDQQAKFQASIDLIGADGKLIASYPGKVQTAMMVGGVLAGVADSIQPYDAAQVLVSDYVRAWRSWLTRS
ncbi:hypothetical protein GCM10007036_32800 [Alsobacter metallidurans]|uniref:DUF3313 domain-containing protein n=1 Tax=Alsobacter metallidurans TaxID=340221 RepID=A0A917I8B2_9HYPH|nr:hypothetical protein [Alsobacter metallidurans]GGH25580.1 hypothetical protein GCM10007036_32800 [Alsobacter metallidurans]